MNRRDYAPHEDYVAPALHAEGGPAGLLRVAAALFGLEIAYGILISTIIAIFGIGGEPDSDGQTAGELIFELLLFAWIALIIAYITRRWFHRPARSLLGDLGRLAPDLRRVFIAVLLIGIVIDFLPPQLSLVDLEKKDGGRWLLLLLPGLLAILVQVSAEEILYRGFLQQQIAARFAHPAAWIGIPSFLFALAHADNAATPVESLHYVIWAFFFGVVAADLTARTGSLGAAIGFHLANNAYAMLFIADPVYGASALALFEFPEQILPDPAESPVFSFQLLFDLALLGLAWLSARIALRR